MSINNLVYKPANYNFVFWSNQMKRTKENKYFKKNFEKKLKNGCDVFEIRNDICNRIFEIIIKSNKKQKINTNELKDNLNLLKGKTLIRYIDYIVNSIIFKDLNEIELYLDIIKYIDLSISLDKYNYFC